MFAHIFQLSNRYWYLKSFLWLDARELPETWREWWQYGEALKRNFANHTKAHNNEEFTVDVEDAIRFDHGLAALFSVVFLLYLVATLEFLIEIVYKSLRLKVIRIAKVCQLCLNAIRFLFIVMHNSIKLLSDCETQKISCRIISRKIRSALICLFVLCFRKSQSSLILLLRDQV